MITLRSVLRQLNRFNQNWFVLLMFKVAFYQPIKYMTNITWKTYMGQFRWKTAP